MCVQTVLFSTCASCAPLPVQIFEDSIELQRIFIRSRDQHGEAGARLSSRAYEYTLATMGKRGEGRFKALLLIRGFSGSGSDFFIESGSAKKTDPDHVKKKYIIFTTSNTVFLVMFLQNFIKENLDPISLLTDGSGTGFFKPGSGSAKKPGSESQV